MTGNSPSPPVTSYFCLPETTKSLNLLESLATSFPT